jgi:hypothetical protein
VPTTTIPTTRRRKTAAAGERFGALVLALAILITGTPARAARAVSEREALDRLGSLEEALRARSLDGSPTAWRELSGADPFALVALPGGDRLVGILRGDSALVLLDATGRELARQPAPAHPTGLVLTARGDVLVSGEASSTIARFAVRGDELLPRPTTEVAGVHGLRDLAVSRGRVYALDVYGGRVVAVQDAPGRQQPRHLAACRGPLSIDVVPGGEQIVANCLLDHALVVLDPAGVVRERIVHDGPFWSFALAVGPDGVPLIAAGGVEDRPLDRRDGSFGYIDSFVYLYRLEGDRPTRIAAVDVSELGVVTPKWVDLASAPAGGIEVRVAGYGSDRLVELAWSDATEAGPRVASRRIPPGTTDVAGRIAANPLLDAWVVLDEGRTRVRPLSSRVARSPEARVGELLFFTTLMAPLGSAEGKRSRFTCETCHHEGGVDGRTHWTGRGDVHATTKPLFGLLANRPYFSRALDPTMVRMVDNEFRVANRGTGQSPWFSLRRQDHPWLGAIDEVPEVLSAEWLRRALVTFLAQHDPAPNPATLGRHGFTAGERAGADTFRARCESCHSARLLADDPESRIPFADWEERIFAGGPILWGRSGYERTGVEPYVHPAGARVPSLRRLYVKQPYFTNGSAATLVDVLDRAAWTPEGFRHSGADPAVAPLSADERAALLAFLALL